MMAWWKGTRGRGPWFWNIFKEGRVRRSGTFQPVHAHVVVAPDYWERSSCTSQGAELAVRHSYPLLNAMRDVISPAQVVGPQLSTSSRSERTEVKEKAYRYAHRSSRRSRDGAEALRIRRFPLVRAKRRWTSTVLRLGCSTTATTVTCMAALANAWTTGAPYPLSVIETNMPFKSKGVIAITLVISTAGTVTFARNGESVQTAQPIMVDSRAALFCRKRRWRKRESDNFGAKVISDTC